MGGVVEGAEAAAAGRRASRNGEFLRCISKNNSQRTKSTPQIIFFIRLELHSFLKALA